MERLQRGLSRQLRLRGVVGAEGLRRADQKRLGHGEGSGQHVGRAAPLCAVGRGGVVVDELRGLRLCEGRSGRGGRVRQGAFAGGERGSAAWVGGEWDRASDTTGTQLTRSGVLPAQVSGLDELIAVSRW